MPYVSKRQARWGNSPSGEKALGVEGVKEWNEATKGKFQSLPERAKAAEAGFQDALRKVAAMAGSNVLRTFTGSQPLATPPAPHSATGMNPLSSPGLTTKSTGLGTGLGTGLQTPKVPTPPSMPGMPNLSPVSASRDATWGGITQNTLQSTDLKANDGSSLPAQQ